MQRPHLFTAISILLIGLNLSFPKQALALTDSDNDLLPDSWEQQYFGGPTTANPNADPDADRLTNLDERFAETDPTVSDCAVANVSCSTPLTQSQLLRLFQGKAFLYFWEQSEVPYYFTHDNANYNDPSMRSQNFNSIAAIGFSFMAYVVADENDWVKSEDAYNRIRTALARLVALQDPAYGSIGVPLTQQGNRHGYLYHFVDNNGFRAFNNVEISTIDHALLTAGALVAASYYPDTEVKDLADQLFDNTQWNWLFDGFVFYQAWLEGCVTGQNCIEGGHTIDEWNRYSELMILLFQAMSASPGNGVGSYAWENLAYGEPVMFPWEWAHVFPPANNSDAKNFTFLPNMPNTSQLAGYTNSSTEFHYLHAGSLHNHQYSHMFVDFRNRPDGFRQTNFFNNSISATMANRQFAIELNARNFPDGTGDPNPYETYGPNAWGLAAGIVSHGNYKVMQPIVMWWDDFSYHNIALNNDSGTVFLFAPLGSASFTPRESIDLARNILNRYQNVQPGYDALVGRYGFMNSFNLGYPYHDAARRYPNGPTGHFSTTTIGIDLGAMVGGIENYLTGLVWKLAMRESRIANGMSSGAGFNVGVVEPFIMNFDADNIAPHDPVWSGVGGMDPNVFGGTLNSFDGANMAYVNIGDPRPDIPYGPEEYAVDITASVADTGGFITLNNHSVSNWDRVSFWIKGHAAGEDFQVGLNDSPYDYKGTNNLEETEIKVPIRDYMGGAIPTTWTEVRIPLSAFSTQGVRLTRLHNISFTNVKAGGGKIQID
ncbi:MAG: hypothetical protein HY584_01435, partial [Candidatus Omnitrophica bacterium]|nr:hypothetical protein [Candidatus Omnitrophota bacterium]